MIMVTEEKRNHWLWFIGYGLGGSLCLTKGLAGWRVFPHMWFFLMTYGGIGYILSISHRIQVFSFLFYFIIVMISRLLF